MTDELRLWEIGDTAGEASRIESVAQTTETETMLEDAFVQHPQMLLPELQLVGRQTPLASQTSAEPTRRVEYPDLLGVDAEGRLVVLELALQGYVWARSDSGAMSSPPRWK